jgi:hypothetical protein
MRQSEEVFSYVMSMNWRYCIVLELSGAGGRTMMVMDCMGWWRRCFSRTFLETFMPESWSIVQSNSSSRFDGSVYTEAFLLGAELDVHGLTIDCVGYL